MTFASLKVILLANLGESDKIAKLQVHGEYSRLDEPTWTKQEPGKRHDCGEKLHHTVGIAAFSVIEIQRRSFIAILTQPRRIRQQYQKCNRARSGGPKTTGESR